MDDTRYNASHKADPTSHEAIKAADKMPYKIVGFIDAMKRIAKTLDLEIENRIVIKDLETGRVWK